MSEKQPTLTERWRDDKGGNFKDKDGNIVNFGVIIENGEKAKDENE